MQALLVVIENPLFFVLICSSISLLVGSFLNVVIYRLPVMMERAWQQEINESVAIQQGSSNLQTSVKPYAVSDETFNLATPRSRCPSCKHFITPLENIPVVSYLCQRGKCSTCGVSISFRYPLIEALTAVLSGFVAWYFYPSIEMAVAAILLTWSLIALTGIDYDTYLLPDSITLPLIWLGLIVNYFGLFTGLENALWGAVAGYLILWSVFWLFKLITGKEGMGYGDFKLLAALGAWLGWQMLPLVILLSSLVGAVIGIGMIVFSGHEKSKPIPFGPYLAIAGWIALIWGAQINQLYLDYIGLSY